MQEVLSVSESLPGPGPHLSWRSGVDRPKLDDIYRDTNKRSGDRYLKVIGTANGFVTCVQQRPGSKRQRTVHLRAEALRKMTLVRRAQG